MFGAKGEWTEYGGDYGTHLRVREILKLRRAGKLPWEVAEAIAEGDPAFPHREAWATLLDWKGAPAATSTEQCVKDAGSGGEDTEYREDQHTAAYAQWRMSVLQRVREGMSPQEVATILEAEGGEFVKMPGLLAEIAKLRSLDSWS